MTNTPYTKSQRTLHWGMVVLLAAIVALGFYMASQPYSAEIAPLYTWHKSLGVAALALVFIRIIKKIQHRAPVHRAHKLQQLAATGAHLGLYALMVLMPLSGWAMSSAYGYSVSFFGWFTLPALVAEDRALGAILTTTHETLAWALIVLTVGHVAAALYHHFVLKNGTLRRMLGR